jgi:quinol-cytochrome oxidoreductase complex cytochrome b subunit
MYGALIMLYFSIRLEKTGLTEPGELLSRRPAWLQWLVILIAVVSVMTLGVYGSGTEGTDFVYMGF